MKSIRLSWRSNFGIAAIALSLLTLTAASDAGRRPVQQTRPPITRTPLLQTQRFGIYEIGPSQLNLQSLGRVGDMMKLKAGEQSRGQALMDGDTVRAVFIPGPNPQLIVSPNLATAKGPAPSRDLAIRQAQEFVAKLRLAPTDKMKLDPIEVTTWSNSGGPKGKAGPTRDVLRSVRLARTVDGLHVFGPSSTLTVDVGADGINGTYDSLRPIKRTNMKVTMRKVEDVRRDLNRQIQMSIPKDTKLRTKVISEDLIYYEQGKKYVQPAYRFGVEYTTPEGLKSANYFVLPAVQSPPEEITMLEPVGKDRPGNVKPGQEGREGGEESALASLAPAAAQANPVRVGMYVVREDHDCWVGDSNAFWNSLSFTNTFFSWLPHKTKDQYYWDHPWLWHDFSGTPDNSMNFAGKVHIALLQGHGAPWVMTCLKNNAEFIHINKIQGFGANRGFGERTSYLIWHSCDVIPAPGDPFGWDFSSGSPFDVWWQVFKGIRANYGYRTTMFICDGVGGSFGMKIGLGMQNLSSWLSSTDHNVFGHQNGWDYGSAVIVSGHEGDTLYTNSALPNPNSLTIWWIHP